MTVVEIPEVPPMAAATPADGKHFVGLAVAAANCLSGRHTIVPESSVKSARLGPVAPLTIPPAPLATSLAAAAAVTDAAAATAEAVLPPADELPLEPVWPSAPMLDLLSLHTVFLAVSLEAFLAWPRGSAPCARPR